MASLRGAIRRWRLHSAVLPYQIHPAGWFMYAILCPTPPLVYYLSFVPLAINLLCFLHTNKKCLCPLSKPTRVAVSRFGDKLGLLCSAHPLRCKIGQSADAPLLPVTPLFRRYSSVTRISLSKWNPRNCPPTLLDPLRLSPLLILVLLD